MTCFFVLSFGFRSISCWLEGWMLRSWVWLVASAAEKAPCGGLLYAPGGLQGCILHAHFSFAVVNLLHLQRDALKLMHILWESLWLKASCGWGLNFLSDLPRMALKWGGLWTCWFLCLHCCSVDLCERRSSTSVGLNSVWVVFIS